MADVIFGEYNPGGKLSVTFPKSIDQFPPFQAPAPYDHISYKSADSAHGYFWMDKTNQEPLFCFGHGLSYTTFYYEDINVIPAAIDAGDRTYVQMGIHNTGTMDGDEVVQLYLKPPANSSVPRRVKDLRGFQRVHLKVGEYKKVTFCLNERDFSYYSENDHAWKIEPGTYQVLLGSSSRDVRLSQDIVVR
jgi:beta-glucosidase